jgi:hypothetical protein
MPVQVLGGRPTLAGIDARVKADRELLLDARLKLTACKGGCK